MASTTITFRRGTSAPTQGAGLTLGEPAFDTTNRNFYIGLGSGVTAAWVGARISGASSDIGAGLTGWIVTAKAIKDYVAVTSGSTVFSTDISVNSLTVGRGGGNVTSNTVLGTLAGSDNSTGNNNTSVGYYSLKSNLDGYYLTSFGSAAFRNVDGASASVAVGSDAGRYYGIGSDPLTAAFNSVYVGHDSRAGTDGTTNEIVIGAGAVGQGSNSTTIGTSGTSLTRLYGTVWTNGGVSAAGSTFSGDVSISGIPFGRRRFGNNIGIGIDTLLANSGVGNIAIGTNAMYLNGTVGGTSGNYNVALGGFAMGGLSSNGASSRNVAVGIFSLEDVNSNENVGIGYFSLSRIGVGGGGALGGRNTAIGAYAGTFRGTASDGLTGATGSIFVGYESRASANNQINEIVIGTRAVGMGSNTAVIGATTQASATIYGLLNLPGGVSAAGSTFSGNVLVGATLTVSGNLLVNGTTTTINSTTISVDDKNIVLGEVTTPSDTTADGGGITLKGTGDKIIYWKSSAALTEWEIANAWHLNQHLNLVNAGAGDRKFYVDGSEVLSKTTLGSTVIYSNLTSVGTVTTGTWNSHIVYVNGGTYA